MPENLPSQIDSGDTLYAGLTPMLDDIRVDEEAVRAWINKRTAGPNGHTAEQIPEDLLDLPPLDAPSVLKRKIGQVALPRARQVIIQEFEGRVISISPDEGLFTAYLTDVTSGSSEESEDVDLPIEDISDADLPMFEEGAIFRWLIGYRYVGTTKERFSKLVLRRVPAWSKRQREQIWQKAEESAKALRWD